MNKINWKEKLSSRKFWCALAGLVSAILVACNVNQGSIAQITAIIAAAGVLVAFIVSEAAVDVARQNANKE